jgi:hypothetical protein
MIVYNESLLGMLRIDVATWTLMSISVERSIHKVLFIFPHTHAYNGIPAECSECRQLIEYLKSYIESTYTGISEYPYEDFKGNLEGAYRALDEGFWNIEQTWRKC